MLHWLHLLVALKSRSQSIIYVALNAVVYNIIMVPSPFKCSKWDILLLETGYLTALCLAPWTTVRPHHRSINEPSIEESNTIKAYPLMFLLFKLMLMSGVVKIQADCPTWQNLTALEYHFATQCLPNPFAWYAHQLHPFLLRLGVAATFVIEIPAAFLLIVPSVTVRRVGAWLQILLQMLIIVTGNYNFFNLLTIALCLTCMMGKKDDLSSRNQRILKAMVIFLLAYCCVYMFELYQTEHPIDGQRKVLGLRLRLGKKGCNDIVEKTVPVSVFVVLGAIMHEAIRLVLKKSSFRKCLGVLVKAFISCFCIIATAGPLYGLAPGMNQPTFFKRVLTSVPHESILVSSGYGLFRRMTGVGVVTSASFNESYGWAGVSPSVVARPEIIVEAAFDDEHKDEEKPWRELNFRWKPGNIAHWPRQIAPHQPRFDWRMWFAALGSYQQNPWFISFLDKILNGCSVVIDLLDEPALASGEARITKVRANLYEYDFTRLDNEWTRGLPKSTTHILLDRQLVPGQVWTRKFKQQYLPSIEQNNPSVRQYLSHSGFGGNQCVDYLNRCANVPSRAKVPCQVAVMIRGWNKICLLPSIFLALYFAYKKATSKSLNISLSKVKNE